LPLTTMSNLRRNSTTSMELPGSSTGSKRRRMVEDEEETEPTPASASQNMTFTDNAINSAGGAVTVGSYNVNHLNVTNTNNNYQDLQTRFHGKTGMKLFAIA
jgi:hypothetical protein